MRIDALTVVLRPRSSWEAVELGTALVRRHARAIWRPWLACTLAAFAVANALAWLAGLPALAFLAMWWLKPLFDRIPLFVLSRAVFGEVPTTRATLRGAFRGAGGAMLGYLLWRRLGPARALLMPVDVLEGGRGPAVRERRRVLAGPAYGIASLCLLVFGAFEGALMLGLAMLAFLFVPNEYLQDSITAVWRHVRDSPAWLQLLENALAWAATSLVEPFYVGTGFGQYLNRRTEIEGWDIELAFRRLRERLLAATGVALMLACVLLMPTPSSAAPPVFVPASPQPAAPPAAGAGTPAPAERARRPVRDAVAARIAQRHAQRTADAAASKDASLRRIFAGDYRDPAPFARSVERAYADPRLHPRRRMTTWEPKQPRKPDEPRATPAWLQAFAALVATLGEIGLWLLLGVLVLLLALTAKHWWPWLRGIASDPPAPSAPVVDPVPDTPEPLPSDIAAAARALWSDGRPRDALALLYRAAVASMLEATGRVLPPGATEAQCLRASQALPDMPRRAFARIVRLWQHAAWADRLPAQADFDAALDAAVAGFRWRA